MWKVSVARVQAKDANKAHEHCMLDNKGNTHPLSMYYLLLFHGNNCCKNAPEYYVTRTLSALSNFVMLYIFWCVYFLAMAVDESNVHEEISN
jgi:hypothetical protein